MILINCPHCGPRGEDEFIYGGDVARRRPQQPADLSNSEWASYIYNVPNTKGWARENWWHQRGCNRWIVIERNSLSNEVRVIAKSDDNV